VSKSFIQPTPAVQPLCFGRLTTNGNPFFWKTIFTFYSLSTWGKMKTLFRSIRPWQLVSLVKDHCFSDKRDGQRSDRLQSSFKTLFFTFIMKNLKILFMTILKNVFKSNFKRLILTYFQTTKPRLITFYYYYYYLKIFKNGRPSGHIGTCFSRSRLQTT
jgi:hypothetical protein